MVDGKKSVALTVFYDSLEMVEKRVKDTELSSLDVWKKALENITPAVEVKSRRVGGATFQVPMEIRPERKESISIKNMILFARKRSGKSMADKLSAEIVAAFNEEGGAYKKKEDTHRMADANRAFAHFRF
jgi:small subunit ribosomal protein S7